MHALVHWSYKDGNHECLVCDLQGAEDILTDIQIMDAR